ncbi:MAG: hypothetical protein EOO43_06675 [Flavobacterium sp.]|nr:MAG: hypothetical protein EOO43_06675 [Flavobacterium sp.]
MFGILMFCENKYLEKYLYLVYYMGNRKSTPSELELYHDDDSNWQSGHTKYFYLSYDFKGLPFRYYGQHKYTRFRLDQIMPGEYCMDKIVVRGVYYTDKFSAFESSFPKKGCLDGYTRMDYINLNECGVEMPFCVFARIHYKPEDEKLIPMIKKLVVDHSIPADIDFLRSTDSSFFDYY